MNTETETALRASIASWKQKLEVESPNDVVIGGSACALCTLFAPPDNSRPPCRGCPVDDKTGSGCFSSPWLGTLSTWRFWLERPADEQRKKRFRAAARREIAFLESLLP